MKFGKELKSQMVPEWQDAYMDYGFLKTLLKDIQHFRHKTMPPPAHPPGLPRALTHYRAFSGLTSLKRSISMRSASGRQHHHEDLESQAILVNNVKKTNGEVGYQTTFLRASEDGGEYELVYFKRLDDEFNKVNMFYRAKVDEVMKEADELNRQMNALIAFRIKVENPKHAWFDTSENMDHLVSAVESSNKELSASISSFGRRHSKRVAEHMDQIDEDKSVKMTRSKSSTSSDRYSKEAKQLINQVVPEVTITGRPASLDILNRVTINRPADTPLPTIKGVLNVPVQTDMKFSSENLSKIEEQLKRAFTEFYHKLRLLKSYSFLNILAFSKIMKKYDKITSRNASKSYLKTVDNSYIGSSDEVITKLLDRVEATFIKHFANANRKKGLGTLKPKAKREKHRVSASLGFFAGCTVALVFAVILTIRTRNLFEKEGADRYMETMFPLYSLYGFIVLHMLFYAGNIYFWKKYKINYQFIFGFKAGTELGYREVLLVSFALSVLALASIHGNLDMEMDPKTKDYKQLTELVPLILLILAFAVLICPFNIIYRSSRYFFLTCAVHVFLAPLYKVVLSDFFVGDQLTSQVQAFRSIEFYFCYYSSGDFKYREHNCNKNDAYNTFSYILAAIPFWWRMLQCVRRFFEEKDAIQGWNSLKYFSIVVSFVTRTAYSKNNSTEWYIIAWVTSVVAGVVATYWDIVFDWGLLNRKSTNPWLRDKLLVPYRSVYFAAIALNVLLRFSWIQLVLDLKVSFLHRQTMIAIIAVLEIIRRGVWNFFRLENEQLNNAGKYRAFKSVPLPFNYEDDEDDD
ncbi:phosphate transporter PHO1 homolog 3 [Daucus carota subsp. sativus]|uniref:phosphate transporter PHO1 homolog 3 n=1 Tax=Daucus carota subsp. sativus TaxID=79200 RepID=UPI0007EFEE64|nr:PREDICTED: phosphate transporter PHO1 homolog 3-like [Daucus carota subsp. sativus]